MKRKGNLYEKIHDIKNLRLEDMLARKGKLHQPGVIAHIKNEDVNILRLREMLIDKKV